MAFEELVLLLRMTLTELTVLGMGREDEARRTVERRVDAVIGHLSFNGLVSALRASWSEEQVGIALTREFVKTLAVLNAERNVVVHSSWDNADYYGWDDEVEGIAALRSRFLRGSSRGDGERVEVREIESLAERIFDAQDVVSSLHESVEYAKFKEWGLSPMGKRVVEEAGPQSADR